MQQSDQAARGAADRIAALFAAAGLAAPEPVEAAGQHAAVAVERAEAAARRVAERREQAGELREQRAGHERDGRVAKALAGHLRANNFERWLLEEALDLLVDGASRILRELSAGQYDLVHDKGEFFVVDHHDAGLRRGVRTLSGGETFQASLALALALSEQLAGMTTGRPAWSRSCWTRASARSTRPPSTWSRPPWKTWPPAVTGWSAWSPTCSALAERIPVRFEVRKDARTARVERVGL